jgi:hypothetical protein
MAAPRRATRVFLILLLMGITSISGRTQQSGFVGGGSGSGPLSPSVVATWDAHFEPSVGQQVTVPFSGPIMLDLLVLWRGNPGWFDDANLSTGSGSDGVHRVAARGHSWEVRFDRRTGTVHIQGQTIALHGANVLLLDDVGNASGVLVAGTMQVNPVISSGRPAPGGPSVDPLAAIIRRSPELFEYLRCDPFFTDPSDPDPSIKLQNCARLR